MEDERLKLQHHTLLYHGRHDVVIPQSPHVPLSEGLEIQIVSPKDARYNTKDTIYKFLLALGSSKVLAESGMTPDAWANTRIDRGNDVYAFGRVPDNDRSWRRPVDANNRGAQTLAVDGRYDLSKLKKLFGRYMPLWETFGKEVKLFPHGVNGVDHMAPEGSVDRDVTIWENDRFSVSAIHERHLKGYHIVISPKSEVLPDFKRQWQTQTSGPLDMPQPYIEASLEGAAIALSVRSLLGGGGEIHNSGNWEDTLKTTENGGLLSLERLNKSPKAEKRRHRQGVTGGAPFRTGMHFHVYIPFDGGPVHLPSMKKSEARQGVIDTNKAIQQLAEQAEGRWAIAGTLEKDTLRWVCDALGNHNLTDVLNSRARGSLIE